MPETEEVLEESRTPSVGDGFTEGDRESVENAIEDEGPEDDSGEETERKNKRVISFVLVGGGATDDRRDGAGDETCAVNGIHDADANVTDYHR